MSVNIPLTNLKHIETTLKTDISVNQVEKPMTLGIVSPPLRFSLLTLSGMELHQLKIDFGKDIVFWGGGTDTQKTLPTGTVEDVIEDVKKNIEAPAPGGGLFCHST